MTEGAKRCWLIKPGQACACRQGHQPDQSRPAQTSLLGEKRRCSTRRSAGTEPSTCSHRRLNTRDGFDLAKNVSPSPPPPKKKESKLNKMQPALSPQHLPRPLLLLPYLRNAKQQDATEDLQISVSQRGGLSRAAMSN